MKIKVTPGKRERMLDKLGQITTRDMIKGNKLKKSEIEELSELFDPGKKGENVEEGDLKKHKGKLYECLQDHTTEDGKEPDVDDSLGEEKSGRGNNK